MKKLILSSFGALALFSSANALEYYKNYQERNDKITNTGNIGLGYSYMNFDGKDAKIANNAFLISASGATTFYQRFKIGGDVNINLGKSSLSGSHLAGFKKKGDSQSNSLTIKTGVNVSSKENPLYVNVYGIISDYNAFYDTKKLNRFSYGAGVAVDGFTNTNGGALLYGANFGALGARYKLNGENHKVDKGSVSLKNYEAGVFVALAKDITEKTAVYVKLSGKYQHFDEAKKDDIVGYPKANNIIGMVEVGFGGLGW